MPQILFARASAGGLDERLSRLVQRKALALPPRPGKARSRASACRSTCYPRTLPAMATRLAARRDRGRRDRPAAQSPRRSPKARCWSIRRRSPSGSPDCAMRAFASRSTISAPGYASLAYLTSLPLDAIKIDRGLVADLVGGERDRIVVKAMIHLARELDLKRRRRRRRNRGAAGAARRMGLRPLPGLPRCRRARRMRN